MEKVRCVSCGQSDKNKLDEDEEMICCAVCASSGLTFSCLEIYHLLFVIPPYIVSAGY